MKTNVASRPHRAAERERVRLARDAIRRGDYRGAIMALAMATEQRAAAEVKESWWTPVEHRTSDTGGGK